MMDKSFLKSEVQLENQFNATQHQEKPTVSHLSLTLTLCTSVIEVNITQPVQIANIALPKHEAFMVFICYCM